MVFQCINIRQVPWEVLKTAVFGRGFQHISRDLANVNAWKTMFDPYIIMFGEKYGHLGGEGGTDYFALVCVLCTVFYGLFALSLCVISRVDRKTVASQMVVFFQYLISSPWRRYEDYNISFYTQRKFRCHCSYEQWHLNLNCLHLGAIVRRISDVMFILFISVLSVQCTDINNLLSCDLEASQGLHYFHFILATKNNSNSSNNVHSP